VPNTGQYPLSSGQIERYCQPGPMCRYASDMWPLLCVLAGPDGRNPLHEDPMWKLKSLDPSKVNVSKLTVLSVESSFAPLISPVSQELRDAQRRAAEYLGGLGCTVKDYRIPEFRQAFDIWSSMVAVEQTVPFRVLLGSEKRTVRCFWEALKIAMGGSDHTFPALMLGFSERLPEICTKRAHKFKEIGLSLKKKLNELLNGDTVLLYPTHPVLAPPHDWPILRPFNFSYTGIFNVTELPATQVPLGLSQNQPRGLPLGLQVVCGHGFDHVTIAVAMELEKGFGGWSFPQKIA